FSLKRTATSETHPLSLHDALPILVLIAAAGTSDLPVAEEAAVTARALGSTVQTVYDVGVAGLHRLLDKYALLAAARVIVVVAGIDRKSTRLNSSHQMISDHVSCNE